MRVRTAFLLLPLGGLGIFAALNWTVFTAPSSLSLVLARVEAPLGVIMLTVTAAVTLLYAMLAAWRETSGLLESRRHARELETFSLRNNKDGSNPRVSRVDVDAARSENWWGKAITVSPEEIFKN